MIKQILHLRNRPHKDEKTRPKLPAKRGVPLDRRRLQQIAVTGTLALAFIIAAIYTAFAPAANDAQAAVVRVSRADAPTPSPVLIKLAATPTPESVSASIRISQYTQLQLGDNYPAVQELQSQLSALGYLETDEPDTVYSAALADAVSLFQRAHGLEINGEADAALQEKLFEGSALAYQVRLGDEGDDVSSLQEALAALGFFPGKPTGYFGAATETAVMAFQQANGLACDGVFDMEDRDLLYSPQARATDAPRTATPTPDKQSAEKTPTPQKSPVQKNTTVPESTPATADTPIPTTELPPAAVPEPPAVSEPETPPAEAPIAQAPEAPAPESAALEPVDESGRGNSGSGGADAVIDGIISTARAQIGKPYRRGSEGPNSYDCSGLVYYCLTKNGVSIGRYSAASYAKVSDWKKITSMSSLKRGDLIFYHDDDSSRVSHVGICLGDGMMIDASSSKSQIVHRSYATSYWKRNFVCGRRIFS